MAAKEWDIQLSKGIEIIKDRKMYDKILSPGFTPITAR
jgi:hypothetical protein